MDDIELLRELIGSAKRIVAFTGAGISTESGIPDFRSPGGIWTRYKPIYFDDFMASDEMRRESWRRKFATDETMLKAEPNAGHRALAKLVEQGRMSAIITQNVDGLHQAAGARQVIELHGSLYRVVCLGCGQRTSRAALHERLHAANPGWAATATQLSPDGDAVLADEEAARFRIADCQDCGSLLKPDVVFFGENVPRARVEECYALTGRAGALVVLGSSLTVMSGYRFVRHAARLAIPVVIVNHGPTRGDAHASLILDAALGQTLTALTAR
jgi:NAD-dependent SIR2 family protein deacetylase